MGRETEAGNGASRARPVHVSNVGRVACGNVIDFLKHNGYAHGKMPSIGLDSPFGNQLALLLAYTQPKGVASYLRSHLGRIARYDNRKARTDLALACRPLNETLLETMADLARWGHIRAGVA